MIVRSSDGISARVASGCVPLGVVETSGLSLEFQQVDLCDGDRVYLYSDGVIEAQNVDGEFFGEKRIDSIIADAPDSGAVFDSIRSELSDFTAPGEQTDDIALLELRYEPGLLHGTVDLVPASSGDTFVKPWAVRMHFDSDALRSVDPFPTLIHFLTDVRRLEIDRAILYVILAELFSNALDHGVLGCDSVERATADGFARYYEGRLEKLEALTDGWVEVGLAFQPDLGSGRRLTVRVCDSGPGFDHHEFSTSLEQNRGNSGRGIGLVRELCVSLTHEGVGNVVCAVYEW